MHYHFRCPFGVDVNYYLSVTVPKAVIRYSTEWKKRTVLVHLYYMWSSCLHYVVVVIETPFYVANNVIELSVIVCDTNILFCSGVCIFAN